MDGDALAPHRPVDVEDLDVDIYVCILRIVNAVVLVKWAGHRGA